MNAYIIYNPKAGDGAAAEEVKLLDFLGYDGCFYYDITRITNYQALIRDFQEDGHIILAGGDGTLNRFINDTEGVEIHQEILYYPIGTGNDFAHELGKTAGDTPFVISQYLKNLPTVEVKGKHCRFLNGVGFGIDGYCCEVGDVLKSKGKKKVNYTAIAIKGLLFHFAPRSAKITVDGKEYSYDKVWIAPTMLGKYYGGGMIPAPEQERLSPKGTLSLMVFHGAGRLRTLCAFPGIFKGEHIKHTDMVAVHTGHDIAVEFDRPTPLQIDGETVLDVTGYRAQAARCAAAVKIG